MATKDKTEEKKVEVRVREGRDTGLGNKRDGMRGGGRKEAAEVSVRHLVRYCPDFDHLSRYTGKLSRP